MRKYASRLAAFLLLAYMIQGCKLIQQNTGFKPIRVNGQMPDKGKEQYRKHQLIVTYKGEPTKEQSEAIKNAITLQGIQVTDIQKCNSCDSYVELWKGNNIHTAIHTEGVSGGSGGGGSRGVGEDSLARYSLNFISKLPVDTTRGLRDSINQNYKPDVKPVISGAGKDTIVIAVLDTGIDTANFVNGQYLWTNSAESPFGEDKDKNCYPADRHGWNFINNNSIIRDDNPSLHGTLISNYIIDEFSSSPSNFVQIMSLKTHDQHGFGDLFSSICAIHYAIKKGANIINASWGFYYYYDGPHPYLDSLITSIAARQGILFITAAGNRLPEEDIIARDIYRATYGITLPDAALRNLDIHNFYPACLSRDNNNVITATTTDSLSVSPTQNYSSNFVDMGVRADLVDPQHMKFLEPFTRIPQYISGSSFATAIATGKIGAYLPKAMYVPDIKKTDVIPFLISGMSASAMPVFIYTVPELEGRRLIRKGRFLTRR